MKKNIIFFVIVITIIVSFQTKIFSQTIRTVGGAGANYATLKAAFDAINSGSITGNIVLQLTGSTTEASAITLNASGSGSANYSSITIYPTVSNVVISAVLNTNMIYLNGADNVTFDGRVNQSGTEKNLTIVNNSTGSSATTFRFINSAENNTIRYCIIKGSGSSSSLGIITFSTASSGNGNDGNSILYNDITSTDAGRVRFAIYSTASAGRDNDYNVISYNNIYNCLSPDGNSYAICLFSYSNNFTISGNSIYETTTLVPTAGYIYNGIRVQTNSNNIVSGNYIGGSQPQCAGSPLTISANFPHYFCGIYISGGNSGSSLVENNVIQNINYTSTQANPFDGIYINSGNVDVYGNTIGSPTATNSIVINTPCASAYAIVSGGVVTSVVLVGGGSGYTTAPVITFSQSGSTSSASAVANITNGVVTSITLLSGGSGYTAVPSVFFDGSTYSTTHGMIQNSSGIVNIIGNNIGGITTVGSTTYSHGFEGIYVRAGAVMTTISNNLLGSLNTANSILTSATAVNSIQKQDIYGIYTASTGTVLISGNTVANLTNNYSGTQGATRSRGIQSIAGSNTIQNNTVRDIKTYSAQTSTRSGASLIGISQTAITAGTTQSVIGNKVYNLYNLNTSARYDVYGIFFTAPFSGTNVVANNFVHSIFLSTTNVAAKIDGIELFGGNINCYNNIISLGNGVTSGYNINGIYDKNGPNCNSYIYFNTVYLGGTVTSGTTSFTSCIWNDSSGVTRNYRNNIFANARTGGSTGNHLSIYLLNITNLTINYNDYYNAAGTLGRIGQNPRNNLTAWRQSTGQDNNSTDINPNFTNPSGTNANDFYASASLPAETGTGVNFDYNGDARAPTPQMGALELTTSYVWQGNTSSNFGTASNWVNGVVPPEGANITFATSPANDCVLDQNRIIGKITNSQSIRKLVVNGYQLTINKELDFSNDAKIDATANNSTIKFSGTSQQNIPAGAFVNNTLNNLIIDNSNGVICNNDFTINQTLSLTSGDLSIGSNTLTLNGAISVTAGGFTGGNTSNISIGGSGSATLPSITLNNLTLNRSNGVTLAGDVTVNGTLTLTNGTMTLGSGKSLTINSISIQNGKINASADSATVIFNNSNAITLPNGFFASSVFNMIIRGSGGITSQGDIKVNGILNLEASNPSSTKGCLDMFDGSNLKTLSMGANAVTTGTGDVTGFIERTSFSPFVGYTFGSKYTKISFTAGGTYPDTIKVKILIGNVPIWKQTAIKRLYDFVQKGGRNCIAAITTRYLESELNGNNETELVQWTCYADSTPPQAYEWGRSNQNFEENWIEIANIDIGYFPTSFGQLENTLAKSELNYYTWTGRVSSNWNTSENWDPVGQVNELSNVIIPDAVTTANDPIIPDSTEIKTLTLQQGSILNSQSGAQITINGNMGAWCNTGGTFNAGTSNVSFTGTNATLGGSNDFYNLTISNSTTLWVGEGSHIRISGSVTNNGVWRTYISGATTIEYNGSNQTVIVPNPATNRYSTLILSGSGTKTMPNTALSICGDFILSGNVSVTAGSSLTIGGDFIINDYASFNTGSFNHTINGNFENYGTFTPVSGYSITMKSDTSRYIDGIASTNFTNLTIDNAIGVNVYGNVKVVDNLQLTRGYLYLGNPRGEGDSLIYKMNNSLKFNPFNNLGILSKLQISGSISQNVSNSKIDATSIYSEVEFNGTSAQTIPVETFVNNVVNNLIINNSSGVSLNGNLKINGTLDLVSGILNTGSNSLLFGPNAADPVETSTSRIVGTAKILDIPIGTGSLSFLSCVIDEGMNDLGCVSIIRKTGPSAVIIVGSNSSIQSHWKIESEFPPTEGRNVTYKWLSVLDNGKNFSPTNKGLNYFSTDDGNTWVQKGDPIDVSNSNPRVMSFNTNHFSYWVASDQDSPLPITLLSFSSEIMGRNVKLCWTTECEINNAGFEIERKKSDGNWNKIGYIKGTGYINKQTKYIYEDINLNTGKYYYRLKQIDNNGNYNYFDLKNEVDILPPNKYDLSQNYPNPFNPLTKINFQIPYESKVNLVVYDILGREVRTILSENLKEGYYTVEFNASDLSSGIYFYRISAKSKEKEFIETKKMLIVK